MRDIAFAPIGRVDGGRGVAEKDHWAGNRCRLLLDGDRFTPDAVVGLASFSHAMVVFYFHVDADEPVETGKRRPRGRADWPEVGIFAQRGRMRPNRIGVSMAAIDAVEGLAVHVSGLDAIDGTPILDLKPVISGYAPRGAFRQPDWACALMADYW